MAKLVKKRRLSRYEVVRAQFKKFDKENPRIYRHLVRLSREAKAAGLKTIGIDMLFGVVRWYTVIRTRDSSYSYKLCNNYKPFYARKIMRRNPELAGIFKLKRMKR